MLPIHMCLLIYEVLAHRLLHQLKEGVKGFFGETWKWIFKVGETWKWTLKVGEMVKEHTWWNVKMKKLMVNGELENLFSVNGDLRYLESTLLVNGETRF